VQGGKKGEGMGRDRRGKEIGWGLGRGLAHSPADLRV